MSCGYLVKSGGTGVVTNDCMGFRWTCWNISRISGLFEISSLLLQEWSCFTPTPNKKTLRHNKHFWNIKSFGLNKGINVSSYEINARNIFSSNKQMRISLRLIQDHQPDAPLPAGETPAAPSPGSRTFSGLVRRTFLFSDYLYWMSAMKGASAWLCSMCMWVLSASNHLGQINLS